MTIPKKSRDKVQGLTILFSDFPDAATELEIELKSPFGLLRLYRSVSLDRNGISNTPEDVNILSIYRRPILDCWCKIEEDLSHIVRHVLIHEIDHHFGFSDADIERIERYG